MCHTHTYTHTYTPTLTHTHSHKPTRTHTHPHTHRHIHYIPNYSPDPAHKCLYARPSLFRSLHEYIWPLFRALLPVQETSDLYPVLLVLVQHDAEEAQDHRGRRQGRQPLIYIYTRWWAVCAGKAKLKVYIPPAATTESSVARSAGYRSNSPWASVFFFRRL